MKNIQKIWYGLEFLENLNKSKKVSASEKIVTQKKKTL